MTTKVKAVEKLRKNGKDEVFVQYLHLSTFRKTVRLVGTETANIAVVSYLDRKTRKTKRVDIEYLDEVQRRGDEHRNIKDYLYNLSEVAHLLDNGHKNARLESNKWVVYIRVGSKIAPLNSDKGAKIEEAIEFIESDDW